jgi:hypothetical protein
MKPVMLQLRLQPAPGKLLRIAVRGTERSVYVPVSRSSRPASGAHDCIWRDAAVSQFLKARQGEDGRVIDLRVPFDPPAPLNTHRFVWLLSHDEVNQHLAPDLAVPFGLDVQVRFFKEGLPDGDCRALVVDQDRVAPGRLALQQLIKELSGRPHSYHVKTNDRPDGIAGGQRRSVTPAPLDCPPYGF